MRFTPYTLQGRFLAGLVVTMLVMGAFFAFVLRTHMKELLLSEARAKASLMVAHTEAIQAYVRDVLRPAVSNIIAPDGFIIEAMSTSFVTRHILNDLNLEDKDFTYRRVAKNARNPESEINESEHVLLERFLKDPTLRRNESFVRVKGVERLVIARPVYFTPDCMRCHGDPKDAPAVLLSMYGSERGFARDSGELAGLDIITVPQESVTGAVGHSVTMFALWFFAGMVLLLLTVQVFFNRLVVHNLRRVGDILQRNFFQETDGEQLLAPLRREEEIEGMVRSIENVAEHLSLARRRLSDYAENLEGMVRERTADLESAAAERSADVRLFVRLLSDLNRNREKQSLLRASMGLIARRFNAERAVYVCGLAGSDFLVHPQGAQAEVAADTALQAEFARRLRKGSPSLLPDVWYIPVQTSGQNRGLLVLFFDPADARGSESLPALPENGAGERSRGDQFPLAQALGRQLGIALDNLEAFDALLRQNSLLDSIVEGIADPLILIEQGSTPVLANSGARELMRRLAPPSERDESEEKSSGHGARAAGNVKEAARLLALAGIPAGRPLPARTERRELLLGDGCSFVLSIHPVWATAAGRARAVVHLRETTEEKRMLRHLHRSEKLAAVGQLAAGLAHEINNPLGVIRCYAELLGTSCGTENKADLDVIVRHVEQAQSVLRDLLDFARPHEPCPGPCAVDDLLEGLVEIFRPKLRAADVEMLLEVEPHLPELHLDRGMLEQVLVNLLLNALDAVSAGNGSKDRKNGGVIGIKAYSDADAPGVGIDIFDNGHGIAEADFPKLFDPFFTTKEPGSGTGLGLTVAFSLVRELGGSLEAHSGNGSGSTGALFRVLLPPTAVEGDRPQ